MATSSSLIQPYLFFGGRCEEAIEFYKSAIGAQVEMMLRFNEAPEPPPADMLAPGFDKKIMHSSFKVGQTTLMASDGCSEAETGFNGFSLSITVPTVEEAKQVFAALSAGGKVTMPLDKTFWSPCYGMLEDKFGLGWMVSVMPEDQPA
jgi:PhnB protein